MDTTLSINRAGFEFLIERNYARVLLDLLLFLPDPRTQPDPTPKEFVPN